MDDRYFRHLRICVHSCVRRSNACRSSRYPYGEREGGLARPEQVVVVPGILYVQRGLDRSCQLPVHTTAAILVHSKQRGRP